MKHQILKASTFTKNAWSGGTTTELFIYPRSANYTARNFDFRLSTATVEVEQSDFTALPGYARKLMLLDGEATLRHENHHTKPLEKFEIDTFSGDWKTTCEGMCTDFNVMTRSGFSSQLGGVTIKKEAQKTIPSDPKAAWFFLYNFAGGATVSIANNALALQKGDFLVLENLDGNPLEIKATENCELVFVEVFQDC